MDAAGMEQAERLPIVILHNEAGAFVLIGL